MNPPDRRLVYSTDDAPEDDSPFAVLRGRAGDDELPVEQTPSPVTPTRPAPKGAGAQVRVQRERKGRRGKTVSVISGVPGPDAHRQDILKQLKHKLGAGGALEGDNIVIQGDHRDRVVDILNQIGYRAKTAGG